MKFIHELQKKYPTLFEIARFLIVGGIATVVDFGVMALIQFILQPQLYSSFFSIFTAKATGYVYIVGTAGGFTVGLIVNYILSVLFVFNEKGKSKSAFGFILFSLLSLVGLGVHIGGMYLFNTVLHVNAWIVKVVLTLIILVYNYISKRFLLFKRENTENTKQ